ncbi:MAG: thioredoxin family protein [Candidatus Melainabacteria bacterium]|jgi:thioredoxin-like negative regulator of GroEL|nr:thioredoxin family protein [Candidatus Melainabacteria bacterium]
MFKEIIRKIMAAINGSGSDKPTDKGSTTPAGKSAVTLVTGEDKFQTEVLDSTVPVVVLFSAPWCTYCVKQAPVFEEVAAAMSPRVKFVKINTDNDKAIKRRYGFQGIPTTGVWIPGTANGALKLKSGFMPAAALKAFINSATKK